MEMSYKQTRYSNLIDRFADGDYAICELEINDEVVAQAKTTDIAGRIKQSAIRYGKSHIRAIAHDGKVYLINKLKG